MKEFDNGIESLMFAHVKNGFRAVTVCNNTQAYLMHRNNTYSGALNSSSFSGLKLSEGQVSGLPQEFHKDDYILTNYNGSSFVDTATLYDNGPTGIYGWLNDQMNSTNALDQNKPIVLAGTYYYKSGQEEPVIEILDNLIAYYGNMSEYGSDLLNFKL